MGNIKTTQEDRNAAVDAIRGVAVQGFAVGCCTMSLSDADEMAAYVAKDFARHRMEERAAIVAWLRKENGLCDCFARSEGECACGAWDDYKTVPIERILQAIEAGEHLK